MTICPPNFFFEIFPPCPQKKKPIPSNTQKTLKTWGGGDTGEEETERKASKRGRERKKRKRQRGKVREREREGKELEDKGVWTIPTKSNEEGIYTVSMDFLKEAENHCILQSPIPITCPVRLIHGLKDEDVPWHISMQVAERVLSADVDIILRRHGQHRMAEKDDIKLMVYTIDDLIDKLTTMV